MSGQVFFGKYYGANVALKEIDDEKEFEREHRIIFGKNQMLHPGINKYFTQFFCATNKSIAWLAAISTVICCCYLRFFPDMAPLEDILRFKIHFPYDWGLLLWYVYNCIEIVEFIENS